jgi:ketopantoate reductase
MSKGTAVIIGTGATGRGHVAQLSREPGYDLVFLDKDRRLCEALRTSGSYEVRLVGANLRRVRSTAIRFSTPARRRLSTGPSSRGRLSAMA